MRKITIILSVLLITAVSAYAQNGFGIKAGLNFNSMSDIKTNDLKMSIQSKTGFHAGVLYRIKLPLGLALQPELLYSQKGSSIDLGIPEKAEMKMHYLQLPVNLQWGVDLVLFRPFIMVSPYIGYAIAKGDDLRNIEWDDLNKFQYGIGVGAGLDIWKFQVTGRYCWDLGKVSDFDWGELSSAIKGGKNRGFELSLAFIF